MARIKIGRALVAGAAGTSVMTTLMLLAPLMGLPRMLVGEMLGTALRIGVPAGWLMHLGIGIVLAIIYASFFSGRLPGRPSVRGGIYGFGVFIANQLLVSPMTTGTVFSGWNMSTLTGSLLGHLVYGALVGAVYGGSAARGGVLPSRAVQE